MVQNAHLDVIKQFPDVDLVGFHGQTLNHNPILKRTFQLGNGEELAKLSGKKIIWDFRTSDIDNGGEGAQTVAFVNLGGVGNITVVNKDSQTPEEENSLIAFDTGPANAPINDFVF